MDSTMILAYMAFGLTLMIAGHISKFKILAFFSIGAWSVLLFEISDPVFVVVLAGLMLWNGYYSIWGGQFE